jgi:hypothetical protein
MFPGKADYSNVCGSVIAAAGVDTTCCHQARMPLVKQPTNAIAQSKRRGARKAHPFYLLDQLDLAVTPGLVNLGLQRAIHAQRQPPALAGKGLQPVAVA